MTKQILQSTLPRWIVRCRQVQVCMHLVYRRDIFDGQKVQAMAKALLQFEMTFSKLSMQSWNVSNDQYIIFFFFFIVLYWYSFHLFPISLWFVHPSPNVLSVLVIFHTKIWFSMNSSFKVFNQWEKWDYRTSETLLLKLRHFS